MGTGASVPAVNSNFTMFTDADSLFFPTQGLSLAFIDEFLEACGGRHRLEGLTTRGVIDRFIKPITSKSQSSYCEMLNQSSHPAVGIAKVFACHSWSYLFLDTVDALLYHFRHDLSTIVWLDIFSINQHKQLEIDFDWLSNTLQTAICRFESFVVVLTPWNDAAIFTRLWCLYELYCSAIACKPCEIAMKAR